MRNTDKVYKCKVLFYTSFHVFATGISRFACCVSDSCFQVFVMGAIVFVLHTHNSQLFDETP